ncbi:MAG: patatin-like phospholipase family protein [Bacteriovoracaceae bacterium]|nr:patatin-like phospholipase family protein [Bacteriovoracaceae bacterium]
MPNYGLVLTGGGARGAYQAGVLKAISEIYAGKPFPFNVITGVSAGSINGLAFACGIHNHEWASEKLWQVWANLQISQVFDVHATAFLRIGSNMLKDIVLGGLLKKKNSAFLLNTDPLRELLKENIDFRFLEHNLKTKKLHGISVTCTNYYSGSSITFFDGDDSIENWLRNQRLSRRETLTLDHVMASTSIPLLFPPVKVAGSYYGDGGVRLSAPLSPAIHLGAEKILTIGVRRFRPFETSIEMTNKPIDRISIAEISGVMLNAIFTDSLESDIERLERINRTIERAQNTKSPNDHELRVIPHMVIRPSEDLGNMAATQFKNFPRILRYLMRGVGASNKKGSDFLSYIAFDKNYTEKLLQLGYADAMKMKDELLLFLKT